MNTRASLPPDLADLEESAFRRSTHNGLADIFGGLSLVIFGITALTDIDLLPLGIVVLWPFWEVAKQRLVVPRVGLVRYSAPRAQWLRSRLGILLVANVIVLVFGAGAYLATRDSGPLHDFMHKYKGVPLGVVITLMLLVIGYCFAARRAYLYALGLIALVVGGHLAAVDLGWVILAGGAFFTGGGLLILGQFLRANPKGGAAS